VIRVQQQGAVCEIVLDRPQQRNALSAEMIGSLAATIAAHNDSFVMDSPLVTRRASTYVSCEIS